MSPLPITPYLMAALEDGYRMGEITLSHHGAGDLILPSGQLVACDPFMVPAYSAVQAFDAARQVSCDVEHRLH